MIINPFDVNLDAPSAGLSGDGFDASSLKNWPFIITHGNVMVIDAPGINRRVPPFMARLFNDAQDSGGDQDTAQRELSAAANAPSMH